MDTIMTDTILGKESVTQIMWNSHVFKGWFQQHCEQTESSDGQGNQVKNLKASKHRFESFQKPLGRMMLWLPAYLSTVQQIIAEREGSQVARTLKHWVRHLTAEKLLMLAMMSDASDEGLCLIRHVDDESTDIASLQGLVVQFLERVQVLFGNGACLELPGYTNHIMKVLEKGVHIMAGDRLTSLVVPGHTSIQRCLQKMQCWMKLARAVLQAEFPDCYLLAAFAVFDVQSHELPSSGNLSHERNPLCTTSPLCRGSLSAQDVWEPQIKRLAQAFKVNEHHLLAQVAQFRPVAATIAQQRGCGNRAAWQQAIEQTQKSVSSRKNYPVDSVLPVLQRFMAWTSSSSGVEQSFSRAERSMVDRTPASETTEAANLKPIMDKRPEERDDVCGRAQEIYASLFGVTRIHDNVPRIDLGIRRMAMRQRGSEAAWLRRRRSAVATAAKECTLAHASDAMEDGTRPEGWNQHHEKELQCQMAKKKRREIEALRDGVLLPANQDAETTQMLEETIAREKKADQRLLQETRRAMLKVGVLHRLVDWPSMRNLTAWSDDPNVRDKLTEQGITTTSDKTQARLFVVESLDNPGERIQWMVALHGGWLMTSKQVLTGRGAFVKYTSATSKRRDVYISRAFYQQHAPFAKIVVDACSGTRWTLLQSREMYCQRLENNNTIALVCSQEARDGKLPGLRVFTKEHFLRDMLKIKYDESGGFAT